MRPVHLVITCEHGGNRIPAKYARWFRARTSLLESHRGYDAGALRTAEVIARAFDAPLIASTVSRLLVDLNRSPGHRDWFAKPMLDAPKEVREEIVQRYYLPYRERLDAAIADALAQHACVLHVASHSFTPRLNGVVRHADVGLLFDPARHGEAAIVARWQRTLRATARTWSVRRNYPYRGTSDGLTTVLRRAHDDAEYAGIELEVNQELVRPASRHAQALRRDLVDTLAATLQSVGDRSPLQRPRGESRRPGASSR